MSWLSGFGAILGGLGGLGGAGASAYGALGDEDKLHTQQLKPPPWAQGLQTMMARALAQNMGNRSPGFGTYLENSGQAHLPFNFTGLTPQEARNLHFVGDTGELLPFTDINRYGDYQPPGELSVAQKLYLGQRDLASGRRGPLRNLAMKGNRIKRLEDRLNYLKEQPNSGKKMAKVEGRLIRTKRKAEDLFNKIQRRGHGSGSSYDGDPRYDKDPGRYSEGVDWGY